MFDHPSSGKEEENQNDLGISRGIYAVGRSFKDAAIWWAASTIVLLPILHSLRTWKPLSNFKNGVKQWSVKRKIQEWFPDIGPSIVLATGLGYVISHLALIPSGITGWKKAQSAINKYDHLVKEKNQLLTTNEVLLQQNQELSERVHALEDKTSMVQRIRQPSPSNASPSFPS